jgi:hypothetical protein
MPGMQADDVIAKAERGGKPATEKIATGISGRAGLGN